MRDGDTDAHLLRPEGFATDAEYRAHLAQLRADAPSEERVLDVGSVRTERRKFQNVQDDAAEVEANLQAVRARLSVIRQQLDTVIRSNLEWADATVHAQMGASPWAKLAGAMAVAFFVTRAAKALPVGAIATTLMPIAVGPLQRRARR